VQLDPTILTVCFREVELNLKNRSILSNKRSSAVHRENNTKTKRVIVKPMFSLRIQNVNVRGVIFCAGKLIDQKSTTGTVLETKQNAGTVREREERFDRHVRRYVPFDRTTLQAEEKNKRRVLQLLNGVRRRVSKLLVKEK